MRDLFHSCKIVNVVKAVTSVTNEAFVGTVVDRVGFEGLMFAINVGTKTDGTITALVEDSPDNITFTAVADAFLLGLEADASVADSTAGSGGVRKIGYQGAQRYVRLTLTTASNAGSCPVAATAILTAARHLPIQDAAGVAVVQVP